jgi:hypothetical protein
MDQLRRDCFALANHYLFAQVATLVVLGAPALAARFFDGHLALVLAGLTLATMAVNTLIARMRWRRITRAWACDEAARHHAMTSSLSDATSIRSASSRPTPERALIRHPSLGTLPMAAVNRLRAER